MVDIDKLERRWRVYKLKSYLPQMIVFTFLMVILILTLLDFQNIENKEVKIVKVVLDKNMTLGQNRVILSPSMSFIENIDSIKYDKPKKVKPKATKERVEKPKKKKTDNIVIQHKDTNQDIKNLIVRFTKTNDPKLSLFIAKKYYKIGDYSNSYKYALITNDLDSGIEESWLLFVKSLVMLDRKKRAIDTLKKYIDSSGSKNGKILLDDIKNGKIR